jgi:hypothetical protein
MGRQTQATRVSQALSVENEQIGFSFQFVQGGQDSRRFAES